MSTAVDTHATMVRRPRFNQTLSPRAAIAVCVVAAMVGWAAVLGVIYLGRSVTGYIEATTRSGPLNEISPAGGPPNEPRR